MTGFKHDPLADVNLIADNLRDRYKDRFSILKELLQNADDAYAEEIRFGLVPGSALSAHPLLRGPGLVVINDGDFKTTDYDAILRFGLNLKAAEPATIGKFGLGMKSVFHFSEAFIFMAEADGLMCRELLNPWGEDFHPDWGVSEAQWHQLRLDALSAVRWDTASNPFILYLPLRQEAHLRLPDGQVAGAIIEDYAGDTGAVDSLLDADETGNKLAAMLPLLRDLRAIQVYLPEPDGRAPRIRHAIELAADAVRPLRRHQDGESMLSSNVSIVGGGTARRRLRFLGRQRYVLTQDLAEMRDSAAWPGSWVRDALGKATRAPDKAQPHAAAVFGQESTPGSLTIRWAVFLPIEEHEESVPIESGAGGYSLTLHGHFFVDAGRNGLYGLDADIDDDSNSVRDEAWIRRQWNRELASGATLDVVIPALDEFAREVGLKEERVSALAGALGTTKLWHKWKRSITANHKWVRALDKTGPRWRMITDEATFPVPAPPEADPDRPWQVFPALDSIAPHAVLFDPAASNLVGSDKELGAWDEEQVVALLNGVAEGSVFSSSTDAAYLAAFCEQINHIVLASRAVQDALSNLLRRGVGANGLPRLRTVTSSVQRVAALISPDRKLRIDIRDVPIVEFLVQQPTVALVWPKELDSSGGASTPNLADVERLLTALADRPDNAEASRQFAEQLLKQISDEERRNLLPRVGHLPILSAYDCQRAQKRSVSADELASAWTRKTLFRTGQGRTDRERAGLGPAFQRVLPGEPLFVINTELARLVLDEKGEDVPICDDRGVLHCLAHQPRLLGGLDHRRELLRQVRVPNGDGKAERGLRFLLHAQQEHLDSDAPLWVDRGEQSSAWRKIWQAVVGPAEQWTAVDSELASEVPNADWKAIGLNPIMPDRVVKLISERGMGALGLLGLNREEYDAILAWERWESAVWKSLPFHETTDGTRISVSDQFTCLEQPGIDLPQELLARAKVIVRSSDARLASIQNRNIEKLDHFKAIQIATGDSAPDRWCELILDWLSRSEPSSELLRSISDKPWLLLESGRAVKPTDFIVLPELENLVAEIAVESDTFGTPSLLPMTLRAHPAIEIVRDELFPRSKGLEALGRMVRGLTDFAIGQIRIEKQHVREMAGVLQKAPDDCPARGWQIVLAVCDTYGEDEGAKILEALTQPVPADPVKAVLKWLPDQAGQPGVARAFEAYLSLLVRLSPDKDSLRPLRLRACDGSWQPATQLCDDVPGVAKIAMLCKEHADILKPLIISSQAARHPIAVGGPDNRSTPEVVQDYFAPWMRRGLGVQVGALVTLLSGGTVLKDYSASALRPHTQEWLLNEIPWRVFEPIPFGIRQLFDALTLEQAIGRCPVRVRVVSIEHIPVLSLLGDAIEVPVEKKPGQLLVGRPYIDNAVDRPGITVQFREVDISLFSDPDLSRVLRQTAEEILRLVFLQGVDLNNVWNELDSTEQFDVKVAERLILESLPFYLRQLKPRNAPLMDQLRAIEELRRLVVEFRDPVIVEEKRKKLDAALGKLRDMLKRNKEVQAGVLDAVRDKLLDWQYQPSSIPFELFQNADDAYIELWEIRQFAHLPEPKGVDRFVVVRRDDTLTFLHWGRPVNWTGSHGFDGRKRGYDRDLEKMLILSSSEKQLTLADGESAPVTGKFGLGFKSVLLACDRPLISSGNLQIEILGGILPRPLSIEEAQPLRQLLETHGTSNATGTLVRMEQIPGDRSLELLSDFFRFAGYLCAFGKTIREIVYVDGPRSYPIAWSGDSVGGLDAIQRGKLPARRINDADTLSALRFKLDAGVVLFGLGLDGFVALPKGIPAVWITGPTREDEHCGFAACAMFDVDPGRARLSGNERNNTQLAEKLGRELEGLLRRLRDVSWDRVRQDLGFSAGTSEYDFWNSLWGLFHGAVAHQNSASRGIMRHLVQTCCGVIAADLPVIPNRLPDSLQALTTAHAVRHKLAGALTVNSCAAALFGWRNWADRGFSPNAVVPAEIAEDLKRFGFQDLPSVSLATVASWLSGETIRQDDAHALGQVLHGLPKDADRNQEINRDLEDTKKALSSVRFYSRAKTTERAVDLVVGGGKDDEGRRAAFAPKDRQLAHDYDETAITFFKFCRRQMDAPAQDLAKWAVVAEDAPARRAALEYLLSGDLRTEMQECVRERGISGTWLSSLSETDPWVIGLTKPQFDEARYRVLRSIEELRTGILTPPIVNPHLRTRNPREILERIEEWWGGKQAEHLRRYEEVFYPNGRAPRLAAPGDQRFDRSEWLVLFGRAAFYRVGRTNDDQHRSYIEHAQRMGWWHVFSAENPERNADAWMGVLDEFYDAQIDNQTWEHWTRSFPAIYKLSRWLESYAELFLGLDRQNASYDLAAILKPRADVGQQGGGIDAPPPGLGIGACFVVRELLRLGHIDNEHAHEHAFVPTKEIRDLVIEIGMEIENEGDVGVASQIFAQIAGHLDADRACFGGAYDIPFQLIAESSDLRQQLLYGG